LVFYVFGIIIAVKKAVLYDILPGNRRRGIVVNQQILEGNWNEIKGKLRKRWGQLTDKDLPVAQGNAEEIVGVIQQKTGETREQVEKALEEVFSGTASAVSNITEKAGAYAQQAAKSVQSVGRQAVEQVRQGYSQAESMVRDRPAESLVICFAAGLVTGAILTLALCRR
jgi:uncharacterized protein YjbJ (UPF0337 family)